MFLIDNSFWEIRNTKKKGRGVFAKKDISKGTIIGDYVGKLIPLQDIDFKKEKETLYLMYYSDEFGIYPDLSKPGVHLLNHSCYPNSFIYKYKDRTLVFALRNIKAGEEITIHYLLPPKKYCNPCPHKCFCEKENCTGTMHLSESKYDIWQKIQKKYYKDYKDEISKSALNKLDIYPENISNIFTNEVRKFISRSNRTDSSN